MEKAAIHIMQNTKKPKSYIIKILKDGSFTIPSGIREKMNLKPGDFVEFEAKQGVIYMTKKR